MPARPNRLLPLLGLLIILAIISTTLYVPSMPAMARAFHTDIAAIQLTLTAFLIPYAFGQLIHGPLSDRLGRRPILFAGLGLAGVASLACALAPDIRFLIAARVVQGAGACAGVVVSRAVVRDLFAREQAARANSVIGAAVAAAPALGPVLGGQLEVTFGWRSSFIFLAAASALIMAFAWRQLPETNPRKVGITSARGLLEGYRLLLASPPFWAYAFVISGIFAGLFAFTTGAPVLVIDKLGFGPDIYGAFAALPTLGSLLGSILSNALTVRIGMDRLVLLGSIVYAGAGAIMALIALSGTLSIAALFGPMIVFTLGLGLALPNALAGVVSIHPNFAGSAAALTGCLQMTCGALGTLAVLSLPGTSAVSLALVIATAGLTGLLGWLALGRDQARRS